MPSHAGPRLQDVHPRMAVGKLDQLPDINMQLYPDSPAKNDGWKVKTIGASSTAQKPHGSPEAGVGGENDRRGPRKRRAAPGGAK